MTQLESAIFSKKMIILAFSLFINIILSYSSYLVKNNNRFADHEITTFRILKFWVIIAPHFPPHFDRLMIGEIGYD
jgi:hypothetical protein